jgi:hypothetical protein
MRDMRTILALFLALSIGISGIIVPATAEEETQDGSIPIVDIPPPPVNQNRGMATTTGGSDIEGATVILPSWN